MKDKTALIFSAVSTRAPTALAFIQDFLISTSVGLALGSLDAALSLTYQIYTT